MSVALLVSLALMVGGTVDPTSARAKARRAQEALAAAEAALAAGDASAAVAAALTVDEDDRRVDVRRLRFVRGRAWLGVGDVAAAAADLRPLLDDPPSPDSVDVIRRALAAAERGLGHFDACADVLAALSAPDDDDRVEQARCLRGTSRKALAHDVLAQRPPTSTPSPTSLTSTPSPALRLLRVSLWLEDGAPTQARADAFALATNAGVVDDKLLWSWVRAFAAAGDRVAADVLLTVLFERDDVDVDTARAAARFLASAGGRARVSRAGLLEPSLADARRELGDVGGAWRAGLLLDGGARLRHRAALLVEAGAWDRLWQLWPRLRAAGLGGDDDVVYAVAFAAVATERLSEASALLDQIQDSGAFARATALRAEIATQLACRGAATPELRCTR